MDCLRLCSDNTRFSLFYSFSTGSEEDSGAYCCRLSAVRCNLLVLWKMLKYCKIGWLFEYIVVRATFHEKKPFINFIFDKKICMV